ncbi:MAG TPA: iron-containing redox enzyme family protein [Acidimicrobiales bacterium]|nr:iron-containing redox enzyme family protein [Acidimicrobiales bacterium]
MERGAPLPPDPRPRLPRARGPLTDFLVAHLERPPHPLPPCPPAEDDALAGDDFHLALYLCYELHYRSFAGVDEAWEWDPGLLGVRRTLESLFELALVSQVGAAPWQGDVVDELRRLVAEADGPSLSAHMAEQGTLDQIREFAVHRSAYQLKEADPHTWAIPRLTGRAKAAMVEIQADEYGGGLEADMHASLFADTMAALGLDPTYGAYLDRLPGPTLATVNLVSLFGLHRRHRGALVGHLAVFEMTSVVPMARYSRALARLGLRPRARRFYDVHVEADARHSVVATDRMAAGLAASEPALAPDIVFGARAIMDVEGRFTDHLLGSWGGGRSSLLDAVPCPSP